MNGTFAQRSIISVDEYSLVMEEEVIDTPVDYDEEGQAPCLRLRLNHNNKTLACTCLDELASSTEQLNFLLSTFCSRYPSEVATMISAIERLPRPVQNNPLFQFLEPDGEFELPDLEPRFENEMLVWHELKSGSEVKIRKRYFSVSEVRLVEREAM